MSTHESVIRHQGIITKIDNDNVYVQLLDNVHCQSCDLKSHCSSVSDDNLLKINVKNEIYKIQENVQVIIGNHTGFKAVFFGYILPFAVMMTVLLLSNMTSMSEWQSGLFALVFVAVYYGLLFVFKQKMASQFQIKIKKNNYYE